MQNSHTSLFHTELFNYLLGNVEKKIEEEGLSEEKEFLQYKDALKNASNATGSHSFVEILENYQTLFSENKTVGIEKQLLKKFPLKISRGLPRVYHRDNPTMSRIKPVFASLPALKKLAAEKFSLPQYENGKIPAGSKICLFTYVLSDGWGDFIAAIETAKILKAKFLNAQIRSVIYLPKNFSPDKSDCDASTLFIPYGTEGPPVSFPEKALQALKSADLVISLPTFYPFTEELKALLEKGAHKPKFIAIGQYGFIESPWFHPKSGNYSMGLHFLETGVLIREKTEKGDFRTLENQTLLFSLFGTTSPQTVDVEAYLTSHKFFLAYLVSPIGGAIYLHALLKSQIKNDQTIDICSPHIGWLIEYIKLRQKEKKPLFAKDLGIQEIEIHFAGKIHHRTLAKSGKKIRILSPNTLSDADFRKALALSEDFVAVRGDQSFSEAVSANKMFFYDGAPHARYFVKDLLALAENRLSHNKQALLFFRSIAKAFLYNITEEPGEWVEETHFQEKEPWDQIADNLCKALQSQETILGCKQLNQIIRAEYNFNKTLCEMVARSFNRPLA